MMLLLLSVVSAYAVEEQNIKQVMHTKVNKVLLVLKDKTLSQQQKEQKNLGVMDDIFDYNIMSQISLGNRWKSLAKSEKTQFISCF